MWISEKYLYGSWMKFTLHQNEGWQRSLFIYPGVPAPRMDPADDIQIAHADLAIALWHDIRNYVASINPSFQKQNMVLSNFLTWKTMAFWYIYNDFSWSQLEEQLRVIKSTLCRNSAEQQGCFQHQGVCIQLHLAGNWCSQIVHCHEDSS